LTLKFELEFHQTEQPTTINGRWSHRLRYNFDVTSEI